MKYLRRINEGFLKGKNTLRELKSYVDECLLDLSDISKYKSVKLDDYTVHKGLVYIFLIGGEDCVELEDRIEEAELRIKELDSKIRIKTLTNKFSEEIFGIIMLINFNFNLNLPDRVLLIKLSNEYVENFPDGDMSNLDEERVE